LEAEFTINRAYFVPGVEYNLVGEKSDDVSKGIELNIELSSKIHK
jgi:hypothetical protein